MRCVVSRSLKKWKPNGSVIPALPAVLVRLFPIPRTAKRKPSLDDLAQLIREAAAPVPEFTDRARLAASVAIRCAVICGGYFREAKARPELRGRFTSWVKRQCDIEPRTARNWIRLHIWVCANPKEILTAKPHSLRQFYILAGILPEDEGKRLPRGCKDDLAKLRRLVRKVTAEAAAPRARPGGYNRRPLGRAQASSLAPGR